VPAALARGGRHTLLPGVGSRAPGTPFLGRPVRVRAGVATLGAGALRVWKLVWLWGAGEFLNYKTEQGGHKTLACPVLPVLPRQAVLDPRTAFLDHLDSTELPGTVKIGYFLGLRR
jgi:hypothetical protein